jgi:exoribonuclease R
MANFSKYKKENKKHKKDRHDPSRNSKSGSKPSAPREHKKTHQNQSLIAVVEKNKKGFAFLNFEKRSEYEDLFVPPRQADQFLHGDRVRVMINSYGEVQDIELIEHRFRELVGRVYYGKIIYERKKTREEIRIIKTPPGSTQSSPIPKVSEVKDGDTFVIESGQVVRLSNIDSPETGSCGGIEATEFLEKNFARQETETGKRIPGQ